MRRKKLNLMLINVGLLIAMMSPLLPVENYLPFLAIGLVLIGYAGARLLWLRREEAGMHDGS